MRIILDKCPDYITKGQRELLISHAVKFGAQYLAYAGKYDGIDYFYLGIFKDLRPRFYHPSFSYIEEGTVKLVDFVLVPEILAVTDISVTSVSSTDL